MMMQQDARPDSEQNSDLLASKEREHVRLLLEVARRYHLEGQSQDQIARSIGFSRPTVSRLLSEAKRRHMVRIVIEHPLSQSLELEKALVRRFGLSAAAVAARPGSDSSANDGPARLAASLIAQSGGPRSLIALSWGGSIAAVVDAMPTQHWPFSNVVQMVGSLGQTEANTVDAPELCRRLARRLGGTHRPMPVPLVLGSAQMAAAMRREELVVTSLELAARSDIALVGVGAVDPKGRPGNLLLPFVTGEDAAAAARLGAVAHVSGHFYDAEGRHIHDSLCDRTISLPPERIAEIRLSILVAWGAHKVKALRAALRASLFAALVTDEETASMLLADDSINSHLL